MKRKMFRGILILCVMAAMCISVFAATIASPMDGNNVNQGTNVYGHASWAYVYESVEEMEAAADLIIIGTVIDALPEQRNDMIFTQHQVLVDEVISGDSSIDGTTISVCQTGGSLNGIYTPPVCDMPFLEEGISYRLYLTSVPASEEYASYYLPMPTMGIMSADGVMLAAEDLCYSGYWNQSTIYVYVENTITDDYSASARSNVAAGVQTWRNIGGSVPQVTLSASVSDVNVWMSNYGNTSWDGYTYHYTSNGSSPYHTGVFTSAMIKINDYYWDGQDVQFLKAVAAHEMGHVMGLGHNNSGSSLMQFYTSDYYGDDGYTAPQSVDISYLINKYDADIG